MTTLTKPDRLLTKIKNLPGICGPSVAWLEPFESAEEAWESCQDGSWLLWIAAKLTEGDSGSEERQKIVLTVKKCAVALLNLLLRELSETNYMVPAVAADAVIHTVNVAYQACGIPTEETLSLCADIVRAEFPFAYLQEQINGQSESGLHGGAG